MDRYTQLNAFIDEHRAQPFEWGRIDCIQLVREWARRATGVLLCPDLAAYSTALGALRVLHKLGYASLDDALDAHFDKREAAFVQRGDIVTYGSTITEGFPVAAGICCAEVSVFPSVTGLVFNPTVECQKFWRVD